MKVYDPEQSYLYIHLTFNLSTPEWGKKPHTHTHSHKHTQTHSLLTGKISKWSRKCRKCCTHIGNTAKSPPAQTHTHTHTHTFKHDRTPHTADRQIFSHTSKELYKHR